MSADIWEKFLMSVDILGKTNMLIGLESWSN